METELLKLWVDDKVKKIEIEFDFITNIKEIQETRGKLQMLNELYDFFNLEQVSLDDVIIHNQI
jgi:hypothetical protein